MAYLVPSGLNLAVPEALDLDLKKLVRVLNCLLINTIFI